MDDVSVSTSCCDLRVLVAMRPRLSSFLISLVSQNGMLGPRMSTPPGKVGLLAAIDLQVDETAETEDVVDADGE